MIVIVKWDAMQKTLIMQYAVTHKWLQRLTHTNIHISTDIPQGRDEAICVMQRERKENSTKHINSKVENNKYLTTFRRHHLI